MTLISADDFILEKHQRNQRHQFYQRFAF